jgi:ATP-dependent helicase/nuclease subunit A
MKPPADSPTRERLLSENERNVIVEASAGTGKTTLLIDRVKALVGSGVDLDRICVVTFTEAAASELRSRLRKALDSTTGAMLTRAWIHTIHAFAARLLREYSHLTGVDPDFAVCTSRFTPVETARRWDRYIIGLATADLEKAAGLISAGGTEGFFELVKAILGEQWIEGGGCFGSSGAVLEEFTDRAVPLLEKTLSQCSDTSDLLYDRVGQALLYLRELSAGPGYTEHRSGLLAMNCGTQGNWGGKESLASVKTKLKGLSDEYRERIHPVLGSIGAESGIESLIMPFVSGLRTAWESDRSRLSYDDLLSVTSLLLEKPGTLLSLMAGRFDHVLIDEFQDTSRIQTGIFRSFLSEAGKVLPGKLSVVGDRKQSIYGWRSADIETYGDMVEELREGGALSETITVNFRSTRSIIRFVNSFGSVLFDSQTPEETPFGCDYSPLEAAPDAMEGPIVAILNLPEPPEDRDRRLSGPAWTALCSAEQVAEKIGNLRKSEQCSWGDFALLMRSTTALDQFITVFEREEIPYTVHASTDFRKLMDTGDLREMLRCLILPDDRKAWIHTMRSAFFGMSDIDISRAIVTGTTGCLREAENCPESVASANGILRQLRSAALTLPLRDFLAVLLFETDFMAAVAASGYQTGRRLANLQYILEKALSGETRTLRDLLTEMDEKLAPSVTREPASLPEEGDAVAVTTIHGAKGLAFRHVFLAGLGAHVKVPGRHKLLTDQNSERAAFSFGAGANTAWWPDLASRENARSRAELRRLLYVAVTRAVESLTIFRTPPGKSLSPALILSDAIDTAVRIDPGCCILHDVEQKLKGAAKAPPMHDLPPCTPPPVTSKCLFPVAIQPDDESREQRLGTAVHAILEKIDFSDPAGWIQTRSDHLQAAFPDLYEEACRLAIAFFETDLPVDPSACRIIGREYSYSVQTPSGPRTRYIDLLVDAGDRLVMLDYKTDQVIEGDLERAAEKYIETQEHYGRDIAEAFGRPVSCYLVFLTHRAVYSMGNFG